MGVIKAAGFIIIVCLIATALIVKTEITMMFIAALLLTMAFRKNWFIGFIALAVGDMDLDEKTLKACGKRFADWLEKLSAAAIIPFLLLALTDNQFIQNQPHAVLVATIVVLISWFCALRYTRYVAEGLFTVKDKDELKLIMKEELSKRGYKVEDLTNEKWEQIINIYKKYEHEANTPDEKEQDP